MRETVDHLDNQISAIWIWPEARQTRRVDGAMKTHDRDRTIILDKQAGYLTTKEVHRNSMNRMERITSTTIEVTRCTDSSSNARHEGQKGDTHPRSYTTIPRIFSVYSTGRIIEGCASFFAPGSGKHIGGYFRRLRCVIQCLISLYLAWLP